MSKSTGIGITVIAAMLLVTWYVRTQVGQGPNADGPEDLTSVNEPAKKKFPHIEQLVKSEELILELTPRLKSMVRLFVLPLPDKDRQAQDGIDYVGLDKFDLTDAIKDKPATGYVIKQDWPVSKKKQTRFEPELIWENFRTSYQIDVPAIGVLSGKFESDDRFVLETKFESHFIVKEGTGSAKLGSGGIKAKQTVVWKRDKLNGEWSLAKWKQKSFSITAAPQNLFEDVTRAALPNAETRKRATTSLHQQLLLNSVSSGEAKHPERKFKEFTDWSSGFQYPSASIVDIDQDGWDDVLLCDRWEKVMLLRNQRDGTFKDITESSGLDIKGYVNCALFFDFDNDGDQDLFLGRSLFASQFYLNEGGKFVPHEETNKILKDYRFVTSAGVADINRDGLLDMYVSTYVVGTEHPAVWLTKMVRREDVQKFYDQAVDKNMYLDRGGPANFLLMNDGSKLSMHPINDQIKQWRDSYQGAWADFDDDGDVDLYLCNDFAPDAFFRNDTEKGSFDIRLTNVWDEVMPVGSMAFGMGVSWGDYNSDSKMDLYISNMYSKAGLRIIPQAGKTDERILTSAKGNFLFENIGGKFKQVAGNDNDQKHVSTVGWSYGGQFVDVDNDGHLDIYVPSGHFSVPEEVSSQQDL